MQTFYRLNIRNQARKFRLLSIATAIISCSTLHATENAPSINIDIGNSEYNEKGVKVYNLNLSKPNRAPQFKKPGLLVAKEGEIFSSRIIAEDPEQDPTTLKLLEGPEHLALSNDGLLQWAPSFDASGQHTVRIEASDGKLTTIGTWTLVVKNSNREPRITSTPLKKIAETHTYTYTLTAEDADNDELTYKLSKAPAGMVMEGQTISWTPGYEDAGNYPIKLLVSDNDSSIEQHLRLKVINSNRKPIWTTQALGNAKEGQALQKTLTGTDADKDALSFSLAHAPQGMNIDSNGLLIWTPSYDDAGEHQVDILASDGEANISKSFSITVANTNRPPLFDTSPDKQSIEAYEASEYSLHLPASDPDGDLVTITLIKGPEGMTLDKDKLYWTPNYIQAGQHDVWLEVSDGTLKSQQRFSISTANTNRAPEWPEQSLGDATESTNYKAVLKASDADGETLTFTLEQGPENLTVSPTGIIEWQPDYDTSGLQQLSLSVSDGQDSTAVTLSIHVINTNRAPTFSAKAPLMAAENQVYQYELQSIDPDGDIITKRLLKAPEGMSLEDNQIFWKPGFEQSGSHSVSIEITDGDLSAQQQFTLKVANTNRPPLFDTPTSLTIAEQQDFKLPIQVSDDDKDTVALKISAAPKGATLQGSTLSWKPGYLQAGAHQIRITASDAESVSHLNIDFNVSNTNRAPKIISAAPTAAKENTPYSYKLKTADLDILEDINTTDKISYTLLLAPEGMMLEDDQLIWTPGFEQEGHHQIKVSSSDGQLTAEQEYSVEVANTNRAPVFDSTPKKDAIENSNYEHLVDVRDLDGDAFTLTLEQGPEGLQLEGNKLSWTPSFTDANIYTVSLKAGDGDLQTIQTFELDVANNNRPPEFTSTAETTTSEDINFTYTITTSDADAETLTLALLTGPKGMQLTSQGVIQWQPDFSQAGSHNIQISVSDGSDTTLQDFTLQVDDTNRSPTLDKVANQHIPAGKKFHYQLISSDIDGASIRYHLVHAPNSMKVDNDGILSWKPQGSDIGKHTVIISVSDGDLRHRQHFDIEVKKQ